MRATLVALLVLVCCCCEIEGNYYWDTILGPKGLGALKRIFTKAECEQRGAPKIVPLLRRKMEMNIAGQNHAKDVIYKRLNQHFYNYIETAPSRPLVLHFSGPTSVGKSKTAELIGESVFQPASNEIDPDEMGGVDLDLTAHVRGGGGGGGGGGERPGVLILGMRMYAQRQNGMEQLINIIAKKLDGCPRSVIILDDIQSLNEEQLSMLLNVFDTDYYSLPLPGNKGETVAVNRAVIILTSDMGDLIFPHDMEHAQAMDLVFDKLHEGWPTLRGGNLLSGNVVPFVPLDKDDLQKVAELAVKNLNQKLQREFHEKWTGSVSPVSSFADDFVANCLAHPRCRNYAARGIQGHLEEMVKDAVEAVINDLIRKSGTNHDNIRLRMLDNGKVEVTVDTIFEIPKRTEL